MVKVWIAEDQTSNCVFTLPVESLLDDPPTPDETQLLIGTDVEENVNSGLVKKRTPTKEPPKKPKKFNKLLFTWRMIRWHIILFAAITCGLYAILHYGFDNKQKKVILEALAFCDDWKQMAFFFGIYLSFAVKKVSDVTQVSHFWYQI